MFTFICDSVWDITFAYSDNLYKRSVHWCHSSLMALSCKTCLITCNFLDYVGYVLCKNVILGGHTSRDFYNNSSSSDELMTLFLSDPTVRYVCVIIKFAVYILDKFHFEVFVSDRWELVSTIIYGE